MVAETCKRTTRQVHARLDELAGIARPAFWEAEDGLSMTASDWTRTPLGTQTAQFDTRKLLSVDFSTLAVAIDEGHTAIKSHPILLYTENPCRDRQWQCEIKNTAPVQVATARFSFYNSEFCSWLQTDDHDVLGELRVLAESVSHEVGIEIPYHQVRLAWLVGQHYATWPSVVVENLYRGLHSTHKFGHFTLRDLRWSRTSWTR